MSSWSLRVVDPHGSAWQQLLARTPHLLFHEAPWADVTAEGFSGESFALILEREGRDVGGLLGFSFRSAWVRFLQASHPYGGILGEAPAGPELTALLRAYGRSCGAARLRVVDSPTFPAAGLVEGEQVTMTTHLLDLAGHDSESLWSAFKKNIRRDVRRAQRSEVVVEERSDVNAADEFYGLYLASMHRNQAAAKYSRSLVRAILAHLGPSGRASVLLARRRGALAAGVLVVDSQDTSHYLMGGSHTDALTYCPNDLLIYTALERSLHCGHRAFDFLPSGPDDPALQRFKAKWGAQESPLCVYTLTLRPRLMSLWNAAFRLAETAPVRRALAIHRRRN